MPFLTLSANPSIGAVLLDTRPAWIWNGDGNHILWSNAAGLAFFGETSMESLLNRSFGDVHPARRHLARLARNARADTPTLDNLRFFLGDTVITTPCLCKKLVIENETVLMVLATKPLAEISGLPKFRTLKLDPEQDLLDALASDGELVAALADSRGDIIASSASFAPLLEAENKPVLVALLAKLQISDRAEAAVATGSLSDPVADLQIAVTRVSDAPVGRYLILAPNPKSVSALPFFALTEDFKNPFSALEGEGPTPGEEDLQSDEADVFANPFEPEDFEENLIAGPDRLKDSDLGPFVSEQHFPDRPLSDNEKQETLPVSDGAGKEGREPASNVFRLSFAKSRKENVQSESESDQGSFSFPGTSGPLHFVWESDEKGRIKYVSNDLAKAVGPRCSDIRGKEWADIVSHLNIDAGGAILKAFQARKTWASLGVWWPVEGGQLEIPVELTGLPIFDRFHGFQGFRGYGLCRPKEARPLEARREEETGPLCSDDEAHTFAEDAPQSSDHTLLMSDDLLQAARDAVETTTEVISPQDRSKSETPQNSDATPTGVSDMPDETETRPEDQSDQQALSDETVAEDDLASEQSRSGLFQDGYSLVLSLLSGKTKGIRERLSPSSSSGVCGEDPDEDRHLSEGEQTAFDQIAAALNDEPFEKRVPAEDLDEDYGEFEDIPVLNEEDEDDQQPDATEGRQDPIDSARPENSDSDIASTPLKPDEIAAGSGDPLAGKTPNVQEQDRLSLPWGSSQDSLHKLLDKRSEKDTRVRSAASNAMREILALDPALRHLHVKGGKGDGDKQADSQKKADEEAEPRTGELVTSEATHAASDGHGVSESPTEAETVTLAEAEDIPQEASDPVEEPQDPVGEPQSSSDFDEDSSPDARAFREIEAALKQGQGQPVSNRHHFEIRALWEGQDAPLADEDGGNATALTEQAGVSPSDDDSDDDIAANRAELAKESSPALTAATIQGVAALGEKSLWDGSDQKSALVDLLNKLPSAIIVSAKSQILFASKTALRLLRFASSEDLQQAGGMEGLFTGRPGDWLTKVDGRTTLRTQTGQPISVLANISSINWGDVPAAMLCFEQAKDNLPGMGVSEEDEKIAELEAILDTATDGVLVLDKAGCILRMNHSAEALFEVDRHAVAGNALIDLFVEESHGDALDYLETLKRNDFASMLNGGREVIGRVSSGGLVPLMMTMGRVSIPGTNRFCAVLRDITEWKRTQEELLAEKLKAEDASKKKSEFLAKVSHEIRTPLNAIIGFSEVMIEERFGTIGSERYKDYLKDIKLSGSHIMSLVNDLLDLSKVEAGKLELQFEDLQLNRLVAECVGIMQPQANQQQIIIRTSLGSRLAHVVGDRRSIRQIVLNLLSNAVKFTKAGGQVIVSTSQQDSGDVILRIRDTGIGMTAEQMKRALEPFRQISSTTRSAAEGSGLGLPLTKALIEANHGRFEISSEKDHGTLVQVVFPFGEAVSDALPEQEAEPVI